MPLPYIDTPRTEIDGNATYLTNGLRSAYRGNLSALDSVENSFQTPSKDEDIIKTLEARRRASNVANQTPRAPTTGARSSRISLNERRALPANAPLKGEFTPMMRSVARNNYLRNISAARASTGLKTPAHLKDGYRSNGNTPGLPPIDITNIYEDGVNSSMAMDDVTPLPQVVSSSARSTPLPSMSRKGGLEVLESDQNMLSLKEQENVRKIRGKQMVALITDGFNGQAINKLDKENFGLKIKIHYLQEQLEKAGPGYNQAALKENTELKVARVTMQHEISRYKKNLHHAERDLEAYRLQLQELREKAKRRQADEAIQREMDYMREEIATRESQVNSLQEELRNAKENDSEEVERLRDEIEDLEATVREKERIIDEKDGAIESLKEDEDKDGNAVAALEAELERAKRQLEEFQDDLEKAKTDVNEANRNRDYALEEREKAEENLKELQDEMANKSFYTKGLNRQIEEKAEDLEKELDQIRQEHADLKEDFAAKERREEILEGQLEELQHERGSELNTLRNEVENAQRQSEQYLSERDEALTRLKQVLDDLDRKTDEKELLQTRQHALTDESAGLQRELANAQSTIRHLEQEVEDEKQRGLDSNHSLRMQHKEEIERLGEEIVSLHQEIEDKEGRFALDQDRWESVKRTLQSQKERVEEQAAGYKRTIEKLQDVELTVSGREAKLQEVIDSEKERHLQEEAVLNRQIKELGEDIASKRQVVSGQRSEMLTVKEGLRVARREEGVLKEKVQALEDEIAILRASLQEEKEYSKDRTLNRVPDHDKQLQKALTERQTLRDQLASANVELHNLRTSAAEAEAERDLLQNELNQVQNKTQGNSNFDHEKVELRKGKLRLENELKRLKDEKTALVEARKSIEDALNAEIERSTAEENRLSSEIVQLQDKVHGRSGVRDRELTVAKGKIQQLERRILELENMLDQQQPVNVDGSTVAADVQWLHQSLDEARKREKKLLEREVEHKKSIRELRDRISELEGALHEAQMQKLNIPSPERSSSNGLQEELRTMRTRLKEAHKIVMELKKKNRELERGAIRAEDRKDLHELLKSYTIEAESLALRLSEKEAQMSDLKASLRRIREERATALKKSDKANQECEALQEQYDMLLDDVNAKASRKNRHDKEIRGLGKEIVWLRTRLRREEKFRHDLAWSKGLMELGERVREAWYVPFFSAFTYTKY
jgi:chromosome segregation ATPase